MSDWLPRQRGHLLSASRATGTFLLPVARATQWSHRYLTAPLILLTGFIVIPVLYSYGLIGVETVNMLGRYLCFALLALSLDLIWGYCGMLCLCQSFFFALGGYAMGMYLAHHGGPEGIIDANGWKLPACLYVVYPYKVGEAPGDALVPLFWKPFWSLPLTVLLGMLIPGLVAGVIGFFVFRSRVRGVFFAILTQAITLAAWLVFSMNQMALCGTNGMNRFDRITLDWRETVTVTVDEQKLKTHSLQMAQVDQALKTYQVEHGGSLRQTGRVFTSRPRVFQNVEADFGNLELKGTDGPVPLREVASFQVAGFRLSDNKVKFGLYLVTALVLTGVFVFCRLLTRSRLGRVLIAIRDNEPRLRFAGYKPYVFKMMIFAVSAMIAGLSGMLYAPQMQIFTPTNLEPKESIFVVVFVAFGGRGTLTGPMAGAMMINLLYFYLTGWTPDAWPFLLGGLFVFVVLVIPDGVMGLWHRWLELPLGRDKSTERRTRPVTSAGHEVPRLVLAWLLASAGIVLARLATREGWDSMSAGGQEVVFGLILLVFAATSVLLIPMGIALFLQTANATRRLRQLLMFQLGLVAGGLAWTFYIHGLANLNGALAGLKDGNQGLFAALVHGAFAAAEQLAGTFIIVFLGSPTLLAGILCAGLGLVGLLFFGRHSVTPSHETVFDDVEAGEQSESGSVDHDEQLTARLARLAMRQRAANESQLDSPLLTVENVQVHFDGFRALDIEHYSVPHYALNVIIGPNGAGKTTLCDVISGKTRVNQGQVTFDGQDITEMVGYNAILSPHHPMFLKSLLPFYLTEADIAQMGVGRKFQTPTVFDSLDVLQNMELALPNRQRFSRTLNRGASSAERDQIHEILKRVRLLDDARQPVRFLSHGQRQWLEISMLILAGPRLLLVDEPAAGLTDEETVVTAELLMELQDEHSIIVIEHDMEFVRLLNSRVTVLNEGQILAQGPMEEIQENPEVIEAYLGR